MTDSIKIHLTAFGVAKDILNARTVEFECESGSTIEDLRHELIRQYPAFAGLKSLAFAVDETYAQSDHRLATGDQVVVIPPVSGG